MSSTFSDGQLRQIGNALEAADWNTADGTLFGQAGRDRLIGIRDSLRRGGGMVTAIVEGRTELWLHESQKGDLYLRGHVILAHLTETGLLASCVDLAEIQAIQAKGISFFRKYFAGKAVFGWRGIRNESVPYLYEYNGEVVLSWCWLGNNWYADNPALRRK